jgi:glutamate synthase (ferredoxin)
MASLMSNWFYEVGVGTAGVARQSRWLQFQDGGTGAAPLTSLTHTEIAQELEHPKPTNIDFNDLRSRMVLE